MCDKREIEGTGQTANGRGIKDRAGDPLFPLMPRVLEALRAKAAERRGRIDAESAPRDEYADLIESICGANDDSQPIEQYDGTLGVTQIFASTHQAAVGQIQWNNNLAAVYTNPGNVSGQRWCSGTLISNDLFLTAGHCFDQTGGGWNRPRINGTSNIISSAEIAQNMHVNFNFQVDPAGNPRVEQSFPILQLIEYRLGGLDFAVIRLDGSPGATWGRGTISTGDAAAGEMLCIIGHPNGLPKRIEAGPALAPLGNLIRYDDIDTLGGNSGSGVLRASDGRIVGVHTNGGCGPSSPNGSDANFGQRIVALIAASPTLQALTQPSLKFGDDPLTGPTATLAAADPITTSKFRDDLLTTSFLDRIHTTSRAADQIGTSKAFDDVKSPALDKIPFTDFDKLPGSDDPRFDPSIRFRNPAFGRARPFVLSTPHHSMAWNNPGLERPASTEAEAYEAALHQLLELMAQHQHALESLQAEYRQLASEYQQASGGQG